MYLDVYTYVPKKSPLMTTTPTVDKFNIVNILLSVEVLRTPEATISVNSINLNVLLLKIYT